MSTHPASRRYVLGEEIARGGQGVVLTARDTLLNRDVAVKILKDGYSPESGAARRFVNEARITAQLQHPGIPPIHDLGRLPDGRPFLAMKLIKGRTLADVIADRTDGNASLNLIPVFEQICQALGYAHDRNVIHRDIKPGNVMVGAFGEVQVMDWGLAKVMGTPATSEPGSASDDATSPLTEIDPLRDPGDHTLPGSSLGTPAFMSPEQAIGAVDQIDAQSDVFGLGAVLCVVLTGEPPYRGRTSEACRQQAARTQLDDAFARLDACKADPKLVELCRRCLSPEKADRPENAGEVAETVAQIRTAADERARRAELDRVRGAARARIRLLAVCAGVVFLVAAGAFGWWQDRQAGKKRAAELEQQFKEERAALEKKDRDGRNAEAVTAHLTQCEDALRTDDAIRAGVAFGAAEKRMPEGGTEHLKSRFERCRTDLSLLRELDRIDNLRWSLTNGRTVPEVETAGQWAKAFAQWGIAPGRTPQAAIAERVNGSLIRDRVLTTLDLWLAIGRSHDVLDILKSLDPDLYRNAARTAIQQRDGDMWRKLIHQPEAFEQPNRFLIVQGFIQNIPFKRREELLLHAYRREPGNFAVLILLSSLYPIGEVEGAAERVAWSRAALAIRPKCAIAWNYLAIALNDLAEYDQAEIAAREALRIEPNDAIVHNNLGNILTRKKIVDWDKAEAEYREAIRLVPNNPTYHFNLGSTLGQKKDYRGCKVELLETLRLDKDYADAYYLMGMTLVKEQKYEDAIVELQKALHLDNTNPNYKKWLALAQQRKMERDAKRDTKPDDKRP